jgi:CBS domain containing-hemolysin-like protein
MEVMTPRVDVVALRLPVQPEDVARAVRESGHSRFPVYEEDLDQMVGILYVKDLFRSGWWTQGAVRSPLGEGDASSATTEDEDISLRLRNPFLVPEGRRVMELLQEMRQRRIAFAVVVDEYGGVSGVLTVKDLVSELVGELPDEFDQADEDEEITRVDQSRWLLGGAVPVDRVRSELGVDLPEGEYLTLGGFLFDRFGHIPVEGECLTHNGWEFRVEEMDRRRVAKVVVRAPSGSIAPVAPTANGK